MSLVFFLNFFKGIGVDGGNQHNNFTNISLKFLCALSASPHNPIRCHTRKNLHQVAVYNFGKTEVNDGTVWFADDDRWKPIAHWTP